MRNAYETIIVKSQSKAPFGIIGIDERPILK
jgi:hypothetical protein